MIQFLDKIELHKECKQVVYYMLNERVPRMINEFDFTNN